MRFFAVVVLAAALAGCASTEQALREVGRTPALSPIADPQMLTGRRQVALPMPAPTPEVYASNSLWRAGASSFFNDARASKIGDILTVEVTIADQAQMANSSTRSRTGSREAGVTGLLGFERNLDRILPNEVNPENLVGFDSSRNSSGQGQISRNESIRMTVAALVTQVLSNGNFVVAGRQEVRVNGEVRELLVSGIVRPQDVSAANTVRSTQMAEARISYGGRGFITQAQNPPVGQQVLDVLLPF
jgi:flagellar L-ring protein FlgH